ncbi:MAG: amino acid adenylation domain-containing protein [Crocinitomicaceae bacterium]|jgi:amino acid adenylation domain-containing protein
MQSTALDIKEKNEILESIKLVLILSRYAFKLKNIHEEIRQTSLKHPDKRAVAHGNRVVTYTQLESQSNGIANHLISIGISKETPVGIYLKESELIPLSILGVMKSGGSYIPLSIYPEDRIQQICTDAGIKHIITDSTTQLFDADFYADTHTLKLDPDLRQIPALDSRAPTIDISSNQIAYIMFTSGSTGKPKGVILEHGSISSYLGWYLNDLRKTSKAKLPLTASICFAASVTQLFTPLLIGETLNILDAKTIKDPEKLLTWYHNNPEYGIYCVPTLWEELVNFSEAHPGKFQGPKCALLSGEALTKTLVDRTFNNWPEIGIWNLYGPTEATANISVCKVEKDSEVDLGFPIYGGKILILDSDLKPVETGVEGDIFIASDALARGYLNRPELSSERFLEGHKIKGFENAKLYNTGDRGAMKEDNRLVFLGRQDQQVKIRGYRVEIQEVEHVIKEFVGIRHVACKIEKAGAENALVAFVVRKENYTVDELRTYLESRLPEFMIPEHFVFIEQMPKLGNGKVNLKELHFEGNRPELSYDAVSAENDGQKKLLTLWEDILGIDNIGMTDNFFDLGGNSLKAIRLVNKVNTEFSSRIAIQDIWNKSTPQEIYTELEKVTTNEPIKEDKKVSLPFVKGSLSFQQTALWFIHQTRQDQTAYNLLFYIDLKGEIDHQKIKSSISKIVELNESLQMNFRTEANRPVCFNAQQELDFTLIDSNEPNVHEETQSHLLTHRYDLENESLIKFVQVNNSSRYTRIYIGVHHIIFDGMSMPLFAEQFFELYNTSELSEERSAYSLFQQTLSRKYYAGELESDLDFWKNKLEGANFRSNILTDFDRPKVQKYEGNLLSHKLDCDLKQKLEQFCQEQKTTNFIILLTAFQLLLRQYAGESETLIGVPVANRAHPNFEKVIGLFTNALVFRTSIDAKSSLSDLLDQVKEETIEALQHQQFPFDKLVEKINPDRNASMNPLFQVMFAYHAAIEAQENGITQFETKEIQNSQSKFDLDLEIQEGSNEINLNFIYNKALFSSETAALFASQFELIVEQILNDKHTQVDTIELVGSTKKDEALVTGSSVDIEHAFLFDGLIKTASTSPKATALRWGNGQMTFEELNTRSNQLANHLLKLGLKPDEAVAVLMDRSADMIVALYGIIKAGGAYMPLATNFPAQRIQTIIDDSASRFMVLNHSNETAFSNCSEINFSTGIDWEVESTEMPTTELSPDNLAYIIYTSGTTEKPKGVMVSHKSIVNRLEWMQNAYPIEATDVLLQKTAYTFDVSVWELFWWSFTGSSLFVLGHDEEKNPEKILDVCNEHKVSVIHYVPSMLNAFLDYLMLDSEKNLQLKYAFSSGEALEKYHVQKFYDALSNSPLINLYGPTEAAVDVTYHLTNPKDVDRKISIGTPIQNTSIAILSNGKIGGLNVPGELAIGGVGLARGYNNNTALTDQKFIQLDSGERVYKTGDLARILPSGNIEYIGRIDNQVKIRGYRVELGEIENQMIQHENVLDAAVVLKEFSFEDKRLVGYYIPKNKQVETNLSRFLKSVIPSYMVPSAFVQIDELPTTSSGKLAVDKLPEAFNQEERSIGGKEFTTDYEKRLAGIWTNVLKTSNFGLEENFYDAGGHSLLLIAMKNDIDREFKINITHVDLFQYPTIQSLARHIAKSSQDSKKSEISSRAQLRKRALNSNKNKPV